MSGEPDLAKRLLRERAGPLRAWIRAADRQLREEWVGQVIDGQRHHDAGLTPQTMTVVSIPD